MRPRKQVPTVDWKITVPVDVAVLVEELLPGRYGKPRYGARSELIETLLRQWLNDQDIGKEDFLSEGTVAGKERAS